MSPLGIRFYLIFVDCLFLLFLWVASTCVLICLVPLLDGLSSLIFIYRVFLLIFLHKTFSLKKYIFQTFNISEHNIVNVKAPMVLVTTV